MVNKKIKSPKGFNLKWVYAQFLMFLVFIFFNNQTSNTKEISWLQFEQNMVSQHDVEKIVVVNKETAEIYIKQNRLDDEKYKDVSHHLISSKTEPQHVMEIGSVESFENKLENAQQNFLPKKKLK